MSEASVQRACRVAGAALTVERAASGLRLLTGTAPATETTPAMAEVRLGERTGMVLLAATVTRFQPSHRGWPWGWGRRA